MNIRIRQVEPCGDLWPEICKLFPRAVAWLDDPKDEGSYSFFAAVDDKDVFLGGAVIDIGAMGFGPLSETTIGFLEDIEVIETHRRHGVGTALLRAALNHAWQTGCQNVRWTVAYDNAAAIALYQKAGVGFVPDEDPSQDPPEEQYTVVAINPQTSGTDPE